jgi:hypothetical protein
MNSFQEMKKVPSSLLQNRLETVKDLFSNDLEMYEITKDRETGEHYLHYSYLHRDIASGGQDEVFHQLMPLESDDVLGILFGEQEYTYPDHWLRSFLRNGPEGEYVWFDPAYHENEQESIEISYQLSKMLEDFKKQGDYDEEAVRKLLNDTDRLRNKE